MTNRRGTQGQNRTEPFPDKIDRGILNVVAIALTVTELFNKVCEKVKKKARKQGSKERTETPVQKQDVSPYYGDR